MAFPRCFRFFSSIRAAPHAAEATVGQAMWVQIPAAAAASAGAAGASEGASPASGVTRKTLKKMI